MKTLFSSMVLLASVVSAQGVMAADTGFYVKADVMAVDNKPPTFTPSNAKMPLSKGFSLGAGYKFNQTFGVEIEAQRLANQSDVSSDAYKLTNAHYYYDKSTTELTDQSMLSVAGTATMPITDRIEIFAKLGLARYDAEITEGYELNHATGNIFTLPPEMMDVKENLALVGIGAKAKLNENIYATVSLINYSNKRMTLTTANLGLEYRF